ncbi:nicotinate phosphoribosyltransferase [Sphaerisporangium rufum]|uniref:Nicotinate phosphoribosyltransferase n=1 Tax=Sphaerisporangium rufum TaxID=1381558 RepID=A0A919R2E0_9ACTN|nr:nicotinate phosphoribosyltransferase [Sphaerisporangium rufum]GII77125.1 nicotinate phosphoribosyltransferase [Sphaerisporangium rufum]
MAGGLLTDLYELGMAAAYLRAGMTGRATFSLFVRRLPPDRGFLVAAGLADCLDFLEGFSFAPGELDYLRGTRRFAPEALEAFARLRFTGDVWAVPEGTVVFAGEPLLEVTAPIAEAQLVETVLLNHVTFQTAVASKAARCVLAAGGARLVDFAFRRAHGVEAAVAVARAAAIAGFAATSNTEAARRYGLVPAGTMAHSYVEAFGDERAAFEAFAAEFPADCAFLVDTYDTMGGVRAAVAAVAGTPRSRRIRIRLDSGDLAELSRAARRTLDEAGLRRAEIFASGGLDEHAIAELAAGGAPIDVYAVGTRLGVSFDAPSLDSAYKLVVYQDRPTMKLSPGKVSAPGAKQVFRPDAGTGGEPGDIVALREEPVPAGYRTLLAPVMLSGRRPAEAEPLAAMRDRCAAGLARLPAAARALRDPVPPPVRYSRRLTRLACQVRRDILAAAAAGAPDPAAGDRRDGGRR